MCVDGVGARLGGLIGELFGDESGQDAIEYALLAAFIGIAGVVLFPILSGRMGTVYNNWNTAAQNLWCPYPSECP